MSYWFRLTHKYSGLTATPETFKRAFRGAAGNIQFQDVRRVYSMKVREMLLDQNLVVCFGIASAFDEQLV